MLVRQISIDKLQEEPKKLGPNFKNSLNANKNPNDSLCNLFLKSLLKNQIQQAYTNKPLENKVQPPGS